MNAFSFSDYFGTIWDSNNNESNYLCKKKQRVCDLVSYMLDRTQEIFVWSGLPKTIHSYELELMLQTFGNVCVTDVQDTDKEKGLYVLFGGLGGEPDAYYNPTVFTVSNPYLNYSKNLEIGKECVRVRNDRMGLGLLPMFVKYGTLQNENEISMNMLSILYRIGQMVSADDDRTYESAKEYYNDIVAGQFGAIASSEFFDGLKVDGKTTLQNIKDLIEYEQYIKASWFNEIGLNSNYNMKRERIVASEAQMNDDALIPLVENMLEWRKKGIDQIKELYADKYPLDDLSVDLNYIWDLDNTYVSIDKKDADGEDVDLEEAPEETPEEAPEEAPEDLKEDFDGQIELNLNIEINNENGGDNDETKTEA